MLFNNIKKKKITKLQGDANICVVDIFKYTVLHL